MTKTKTKKSLKETLRKVVSSTRRTAVSKTKTTKNAATASSQKAIPLAKDLYIDPYRQLVKTSVERDVVDIDV